MFKKCQGLASILFLLLLTSCQLTPQAPPTEQLAELDAKVEAGEYGAINSLLIWHDGSLILESYYGGTGPDTMSQVYSVTKSITSAAIGQALAEGAITNLDETLLDYLPESDTIENLDGRKTRITLEDLLTMRAGFAWDESSTIYGDANNDVTQMTNSTNWIQYMLDQEMATEPGTAFTYNSGVTMLLGAILEEATGQTTEDYVAAYLFAPLEITEWRWQETPTGRSNTGWGLFMRPADMVKIGQLYLQQGAWQGEQLIAKNWVEQSTQPLVPVSEMHDYGYHWWRFADENPIVADLNVNDLFFAWGFGGNFIFVVPHLDLVVVTTAENFVNAEQFWSVLPEHIFPIFD